MKKALLLLTFIAAIVVAVVLVVSCDGHNEKLSKEDVEEVIVEDPSGNYISQAGHDSLLQIYADNNADDTTGFSAHLNEIFDEIAETEGYRPKLILTPKSLKPVAKMVYLDNTTSMQGFFERKPGSKSDVTGFVSILTELKDIVGGNSTQSYYIDKKGIHAAELGDMIQTVNSKQMKSYDAYLMDVFLDSIVTRTINDTIYDKMSFFVTDAIMSGTNEDIKKNPKYNIEQAEYLSSKIGDVLKKLNDKNYGVALIRLNALYDGVYCNYCNNQAPTKAVSLTEPRPLFIMVLGPASEILTLEKKIKEDKIFDDQKPKMLIAATKASNPTILVNNITDEIDREGSTFTVKSEKEKPTVDLRFSLNNLPEYMQNQETAAKAIEFKLDNQDIDLSTATYDEASNCLVYPITLNNDEYKVDVRVKNVLPVWVEQFSSANDEDIKNQSGTTFNLNWLAQGLINGIYDAPAGKYLTPEKATYTIVKESNN